MKWSRTKYYSYENVVKNLEKELKKEYPERCFEILSYNIVNDICYVYIRYKVDVRIDEDKSIKDIINTELTIYKRNYKYTSRFNHSNFIHEINKQFNLKYMVYYSHDFEVFDYVHLPHTLHIFSGKECKEKYLKSRKQRLRKYKLDSLKTI